MNDVYNLVVGTYNSTDGTALSNLYKSGPGHSNLLGSKLIGTKMFTTSLTSASTVTIMSFDFSTRTPGQSYSISSSHGGIMSGTSDLIVVLGQFGNFAWKYGFYEDSIPLLSEISQSSDTFTLITTGYINPVLPMDVFGSYADHVLSIGTYDGTTSDVTMILDNINSWRTVVYTISSEYSVSESLVSTQNFSVSGDLT